MDPQQGDITLVVGPDRVELKSHKGTLEVASDVFKKMLQPCFLEGHSKSIELPEDNPAALGIILNVTHFKPVNCPAPPVLRDLATLIDKYNFVCMGPTVAMWRYRQANYLDVFETGCWLEIAHAVRDAGIFREVTKELVLSSRESYESLLDGDSNLPTMLPVKLEAQRNKNRLDILDSLFKLLEEHLCSSSDCRDGNRQTLMRYMREHQLRPFEVGTKPLMDTCKKLEAMVALKGKDCPFAKHDGCRSSSYGVSRQDMQEKWADSLSTTFRNIMSGSGVSLSDFEPEPEPDIAATDPGQEPPDTE